MRLFTMITLQKKFIFVIFLFLIPSTVFAQQKGGVNVTMPLVEKTLNFIQKKAFASLSDAVFLKAGVIRICGEDFSRPGCKDSSLPIPRKGLIGPDANRAWRLILESAMAAEIFKKGSDFDKIAFQRFVMDAMVVAMNDPGSFYIAPSVYKKISMIPLDFTGFGFRVISKEKNLSVISIHTSSPAHKVGLNIGDKIIKVNGLDINGYKRPIALAAIWGADGNTIVLTVKRKDLVIKDITIVYNDWKFIPFSVERNGDLVVVKIRYFGAGLAEQILKELKDAKGLVLDIKDAIGGNAIEMVKIADLLLGDVKIGSKKMRATLGSRNWVATANSKGENLNMPVAVVINNGTSGFAEVLASALRQAGRALIIGKQTAGINTQETLQSFSDGSAIQVTSSYLQGPNNKELSHGVFPHLKTNRINTVELAINILNITKDFKLENLLKAARKALSL